MYSAETNTDILHMCIENKSRENCEKIHNIKANKHVLYAISYRQDKIFGTNKLQT